MANNSEPPTIDEVNHLYSHLDGFNFERFDPDDTNLYASLYVAIKDYNQKYHKQFPLYSTANAYVATLF